MEKPPIGMTRSKEFIEYAKELENKRVFVDGQPQFIKGETPIYYIGAVKKIEAFDVISDFQPHNYNLGTAITYLLRAGKKPNNPVEQDIKKAINHLKNELKRLDIE